MLESHSRVAFHPFIHDLKKLAKIPRQFLLLSEGKRIYNNGAKADTHREENYDEQVKRNIFLKVQLYSLSKFTLPHPGPSKTPLICWSYFTLCGEGIRYECISYVGRILP